MIDFTLKGIIKVKGDRIDRLRLIHDKSWNLWGIYGIFCFEVQIHKLMFMIVIYKSNCLINRKDTYSLLFESNAKLLKLPMCSLYTVYTIWKLVGFIFAVVHFKQ